MDQDSDLCEICHHPVNDSAWWWYRQPDGRSIHGHKDCVTPYPYRLTPMNGTQPREW